MRALLDGIHPCLNIRRIRVKRPKMIIFDYGHTLLYEPGFDGPGEEEVFKCKKQ